MRRNKNIDVFKKSFLFALLFCIFLMIPACDFIVGKIELGGFDDSPLIFTVHFTVNEDFNCSTCDEIRGEKGTVIILPTPTPVVEGYFFDGWWSEGELNYHFYGCGGEAFTIDGDVVMVPQKGNMPIQCVN